MTRPARPRGTVRIDPDGVIRETRGGATTVYDRESLPEAFTEEEVFGPPVLRVDSPRLVPSTREPMVYEDPADPSQTVTVDPVPPEEIEHVPQKVEVLEDLTAAEEREIREKAESLGLPGLEAPAPSPKIPYDTRGLPPQSGGPADLDAARREVRNVARHIYNAGGGFDRFKASPRAWAAKAKGTYSRKIVRDWQMKAGLEPDGLYGPRTRQRMLDLGAPLPPPPLFVLRR